jgi:MFS family permease
VRSIKALTEGLPKTFWVLWTGLLINRIGSFVVPLFTIYLTQTRGLDLTDAGWATSLYGVGGLASSILGGALADRFGRRRSMLFALTTGAASLLLFSAAKTTATIFIGAFVLGLFGDLFRPAAHASVADVVAPERRLQAFTLQYWAANLGFSAAAIVGGALSQHHFQWLFWGDACTTLVFALVVWFAVPETKPPLLAPRQTVSLLTPFLDAPFAYFLLLTWLTNIVFFQHLVVLPFDMLQKGMDSQMYGLAIATNGLLIVLLQPFAAHWVKAWPRHGVLAFAALLVALGFALVPWAGSLSVIALTVCIWTLGEILYAPVNATVVAESAPPDLRGRYQGAFGAMWSLTAFTAPVIGTSLVGSFGLTTFWLCCGALGTLVAVLQWFRRPTKAPSKDRSQVPA